MRNERRVVLWIAQKTGHIAHEHQTPRLQRNGCLGCGNVSVTVVNLPSKTPRCRTNHGRYAAPNAFAQGIDIDIINFAHKSRIDWHPSVTYRRKFSATENVRPGESPRLSAEILNCFYDLRIDL